MAFIFISYGDDRFRVSLDRILRQAKKSGLFDKVMGYTPQSLPEHVRSSPLFNYPTGGGCWCWKPFIIQQTLQKCKNGDLVCYADAGCTLDKDSPEWEQWKTLLQTHSAIFMQYRPSQAYSGWEKYTGNIPGRHSAIKHWMKPSLVAYFKQIMDPSFLEFDKIMAGCLLFKKTESPSTILQKWNEITFSHPELVMPLQEEERPSLPDDFYAHRYDQSILTPLVFYYGEREHVAVIPETAESRIGKPAVIATRWRQAKLPAFQYWKYRLWEIIHVKK